MVYAVVDDCSPQNAHFLLRDTVMSNVFRFGIIMSLIKLKKKCEWLL